MLSHFLEKVNKNLEFTGIEYYKSDSDEFKGYLSEYKSGSDELANAEAPEQIDEQTEVSDFQIEKFDEE